MRAASAFAILLWGFCGFAFIPAASGTDQNNQDWRFASDSGGVKLYSRVHAGSALKEFKAIGTIDASTRVVHNVISDVEGYPKFMPFTAECRVLRRQGNSTYVYQRISPKIVSDRDYTLLIEEKSWAGNAGLVYSKHWRPANEMGPTEKKGVLRVKLCDGGWLLEPETAGKTRVTYSIYTDTGGSLPAFIANAASGIGIRKIFAAIRRQVREPKYHAD